MSNLFAIISAVKEVIALIKQVIQWIKDAEAAKVKKIADEKQKAIEDAKKAQTLKEVQDAQNRINNPNA
jgi:lysyl-tRNA synthetase class I